MLNKIINLHQSSQKLELQTKKTLGMEKRVIIYNIDLYKYKVSYEFNYEEINSYINAFQNEEDKLTIIQIDQNEHFFLDLLNKKYLSEFQYLNKIKNINIDYIFDPLNGDKFLCFKLGIIKKMIFPEIKKYYVEFFFIENYIFINNKDGYDSIFDYFKNKYRFNSDDNMLENFMNRNNSILSNSDSDTSRNEIVRKEYDDNVIINNLQHMQHQHDQHHQIDQHHHNHEHIVKTFEIDNLIFFLLIQSLDELLTYSEELIPLYEYLMNLDTNDKIVKEQKEFYIKIQNLECSMLNIKQEIEIKKNLFNQVMLNFNEINNYFEKYFYYFFESLNEKVRVIDNNLEITANSIKIIKQSYSIKIEENNNNLSNSMNVRFLILTIMTIGIQQILIMFSIFSQNIKIVFQDMDNLYPFFLGIFFMILLSVCQIYIFNVMGAFNR